MAKPKSKKAPDDTALPQPQPFPKGIDTTIEEDVVAAPRISRKRGGDFDDFEGQEGNDEAIPTKATKAKTTPAKPDKKAKAKGTSIAEGISSTTRVSRKRGGDFDDFEGNDDAPSIKAAKPKAEKPNKKAKVASALAEGTKQSKADGHAIETEKTHPDSDSVEIDATEAARSKKSKASKGKGTDAATKDKAKPAAKEPKPKEVKKAKEKSAPTSKVEASKAEAVKPAAKETKAKKSKKAEKADDDSMPQSNAPESSKADVITATEKAQKPKKAKKVADEPAADKKIPAFDKPKAGRGRPKKSAMAESKDKPKKEKAASTKATAAKEHTEPAPELAMDEGPFNALLDSEKGKLPGTQEDGNKRPKIEPKKGKKGKAGTDAAEVEKKPSKASKAEKGKEVRKPKDEKPKGKGKGKVTDGAEGESKTDSANSKKRKAPATTDADALKADVLDPLVEHASSKKKAKKNMSSLGAAGDKLGELFASGLDAATQSANAAREYITDAATGAQNSIMGNVTEMAEANVDAKNDAKKAAKSQKGKAKGKAKEVVDANSLSKAPNLDEKHEAPAGTADEDGEEEDDSSFEEDDQTMALIRGFEDDKEDDNDTAGDSPKGFEPGQELPSLPEGKQIPKRLKSIKSTDDGPGVVYVGRIPHGFYEHQMRQYFSQFGPIVRLRLSRNKQTGASRHYAFLEFESASVAKIVAETMNNYLMFGHILKTQFVEKEQVHEGMWKGANRRFKKVPWNKIEGRKLEMGVGREEWEKRIERENERRASKADKLKDIGYDFDAPTLKGVDTVPVKESKKDAEVTEETLLEESKTVVTSPPHAEGGTTTTIVTEEIVTTKVKKTGKGKAEDGAVASAAKKGKETAKEVVKKGKRKSEDGDVAVAKEAKKAKKAA